MKLDGRQLSRIVTVFAVLTAFAALARSAEPLPLVAGVELQPLKAQVARVVQALELAGAPLAPEAKQALDAALTEQDPAKSLVAIQNALDPLCVAGVTINPESRVKVAEGQASKKLVQHGWRVLLVKVANEAGVTAPLQVSSPNAAKLHKPSTGKADPPQSISPQDVSERWLDVSLNTSQPLNKALSGLPLEYRLIELYSRDVGGREAKLMFDVGQGTQDLGFRNELNVLFQCEPAVHVALEVLDDDGKPTTGQFVFRDAFGAGLSLSRTAHGARPVLSRSDLSPQRRDRAAPAGQIHGHLFARTGISHSDPRDQHPQRRDAPRKLSFEALDQAGRSRLVFRRSSCA